MEDFEPVGPGIATYPNGDIFEGSYYGGKRHGFGKYTFTKDAATYEGNYTDNQKAGFGTMSFPDKSSYTGLILHGRPYCDSLLDNHISVKPK